MTCLTSRTSAKLMLTNWNHDYVKTLDMLNKLLPHSRRDLIYWWNEVILFVRNRNIWQTLCATTHCWISYFKPKAMVTRPRWEYSKNPYPLIICTIPNEVTIGVLKPCNHRLSGSWAFTVTTLGIYVESQWVWLLLLSIVQFPMAAI